MQATVLSIFFYIVMTANGNPLLEQASPGSRRHFMILQPLRLISSVSGSGSSAHISTSGLGTSRAIVNSKYPLLPTINIRNNNKFGLFNVPSPKVQGVHMPNAHAKSIQHSKSHTRVDNSSNLVNKARHAFASSQWSAENNSSRNIKQTFVIANTANIITNHPGDNDQTISRQRTNSIVINNNNVHGNGVMNNNKAHGGGSIVNDIKNNIKHGTLPLDSSKPHTPVISDALPGPLARSQPVKTMHVSSASSSANVVTNTGSGNQNLPLHREEGTGRQLNDGHSHQQQIPKHDPVMEQNATHLAMTITKALLQYPETRTMFGQPRTNVNGMQSVLSSLFSESQAHNNVSFASAASSSQLHNTQPVASTAQSASSNISFIDPHIPHTSPSPWELSPNQNIPHGQHGMQTTPVPSVHHLPIHSKKQNGQVDKMTNQPTDHLISNSGNIKVMARLPSHAGTFGIPSFNGHGTIGSQHSNIVHSETKIDIRPNIHINSASNTGFHPITTSPSWMLGGPYKNFTHDHNPFVHSHIPSSGPTAKNSPLHHQANQVSSPNVHLHPYLRNLHNESIDIYSTAISSIVSLLNMLGNTTLNRSPAQTQPSLPVSHLHDISVQGQVPFSGGAHAHGSTASPLNLSHNHSGGHLPADPINHGHINSNGHQQGNPTWPHDHIRIQVSVDQHARKLNHGLGNPTGPHDPAQSHSSIHQPAGPLNQGLTNSNSHQQGNPAGPYDPAQSHSNAHQPAGSLNHGLSNSNNHQQGSPAGTHDTAQSHSRVHQPAGLLNHGLRKSNSPQQGNPAGPHDPAQSHSSVHQPAGPHNHGLSNSNSHQQGIPTAPHNPAQSHSSVKQPNGQFNHGSSNSNGHHQGNPTGPNDRIHIQVSVNQPAGNLNHGHSNSNVHQQRHPIVPHEPTQSHSNVHQSSGPLHHGASNSNTHQQGNPAGPHDHVQSHSSAGPFNHGLSNSNSHQQGNPAGPHDPAQSHSSVHQPAGSLNHGLSNSNNHQQGNPAGPHDPAQSHSSVHQPAGSLNHGPSNPNIHQQGHPAGPHSPAQSHSSVHQPAGSFNHGLSNSNSHQQGNPAGPHEPAQSHSSVYQPAGPLNHGLSNSNSHQQGHPAGPHDPAQSHSSVHQPAGSLNHGLSNSNSHQQGHPAGPHDPAQSHSSVHQPAGPLNHGLSNSNSHQQGNSAGPHDPAQSHSSVHQPAGSSNHGLSNSNSHQQGHPAGPLDPAQSHSSVHQPAGPLNHGLSNSNSHQQGNLAGSHDPLHSQSSVYQPIGHLEHAGGSQHSSPTGQAEHFRLPGHQVHINTSSQMQIQLALRNDINSQLHRDIQHLILQETQRHSPSNRKIHLDTQVIDQFPTHPRPQRSIANTRRMKRAALHPISKPAPDTSIRITISENIAKFQSAHKQTGHGKSADNVSNPNTEVYTSLIKDVPLTWPHDFKISHFEQPGGTSQLIIEAGKGNIKKRYTVSAHSKRIKSVTTLPQLEPLRKLQRLTQTPMQTTTTQIANITTEEPPEYEAI